MRKGVWGYNHSVFLRFLSASCCFAALCASAPSTPSTGPVSSRSNPLGIDLGPAPPPDKGPPISAGAIRDPAYLPAQIGGIVGSYAVSLVLVALLLLILSKKRRERIEASETPEEDKAGLLAFNPFPAPFQLQTEHEYRAALAQAEREELASRNPYHHHPHPQDVSPLSPAKSHYSAWTVPSPTTSTVLASGLDLSVDQRVVQQDRAMAQSQLEDMYKYVMEQEEAKAAGREYEGPPLPTPSVRDSNAPNSLRKNKPTGLDLSKQEKSQSRGSSILSFLKSPRKSKSSAQGMSISSPIMTPMSGTFPGQQGQEMNPMPPRNYGVIPPPAPALSSDLPFRRPSAANTLPTPEMSPVSAGGIDERIDAALARPPTRESRAAARSIREKVARDASANTSGGSGEEEPASAISEQSDRSLRSNRSSSGLVGLPMSPKPGVNRFPSLDSLPSSPKPGSTFSHSSKPTAIRTGGTLPLRAYEPSLASPSASSHVTKQTVFTRAAEGPLSPGMQTGMRTPWTGAPVPYTPYMPFSPVVPITPSLVTRADRKRMRKFEPKTPTVEMVKSEDEMW